MKTKRGSLVLLSFPLFITAKGKECATNLDCIGIGETSCVKDFDQRLRCLCGDFNAPSNGYCTAKEKGEYFFTLRLP